MIPSNPRPLAVRSPSGQTSTTNRSPDALVVGGGVIGLATAWELAERGLTVTVVERERLGSGASWGNCGLVVPEHVLPLSSWENLLAGLRWMLRRDAPLHIRPRPDAALARWMLTFAARCRQDRVRTDTAAKAALIGDALKRYDDLVRRAGLNCGWEVRGSLHLYTCRREFEAFSESAAVIQRYGSGLEPLEGAALRNIEPNVSPRVVGAWQCPDCGQVRPEALVTELGRVLAGRGVEIVENDRLTGFQVRGGRARAAITESGRRSAGAFVVATGAWTPQLSSALGCKLPIQPGKGYALTMPARKEGLRRPCFFEEAHVVATPWADALRLGGTMEFAGYDEDLNRRRLAALMRAGRDYLQPAPSGPVQEEWYGWRPMTPDSLPFIDRVPGMDNVVVAAGHNMAGISLAPITAAAVAALLTGQAPPLDLHPYRIGRFGG